VVAVDTAEIEVIATYLEITPEQVTELYTDPDPDDPAGRVLRNRNDTCVFLDSNLCMIYAARPKACRDFPHVAVRATSVGNRMSSFCRTAAICPIIYNALEAYKHLVGWSRH